MGIGQLTASLLANEPVITVHHMIFVTLFPRAKSSRQVVTTQVRNLVTFPLYRPSHLHRAAPKYGSGKLTN
jgi:hypothetical protein